MDAATAVGQARFDQGRADTLALEFWGNSHGRQAHQGFVCVSRQADRSEQDMAPGSEEGAITNMISGFFEFRNRAAWRLPD